VSIKLVAADGVDFKVFTATLNRAYADYFVPLSMTPDELRTRVLQDNIRLDLSCAVYDDERMVGLAMVARRGNEGWIGGVGVIPQYRGRGIGRQIMDYVMARATADGIKRVRLEVITANERARALYDSLGFQQLRLLHIAEGRSQGITPSDAFTYKGVSAKTVLAYNPLFHIHELPWQRSPRALAAIAVRLQGYVAVQNDEVLAYALGVFQTHGIRLVDLAQHPTAKQGASALRGLLAHLHGQFPLAQGSIINIAENDPAWAVLYVLGYQPYMSQHEMAITF
jgi:ribosomal protein S18 acetylase RimI-like enzyme